MPHYGTNGPQTTATPTSARTTPSYRTPTQSTGEGEINRLNLRLKSTPWYQDWFRSRGINPNAPIKLNSSQQQDLQMTAARNGMPLGDRMKFDAAGNINQRGGFAGMPTWAKTLIAAAPIAATAGFGAAGLGPMAGLFGAGGGTGVGAGAGLTAAQLPTGALVGSTALGAAPAVAGGTALATGATAGGGLSGFLSGNAMPLIGMGTRAAGAFLEGRRESGERQKDRFATQNKLIADFLSGIQGQDVQEDLTRSRTGLEATQLDPYAHARALNAARVRSSYARGVSPEGRFTGQLDVSALDPESLQRTGDYFYRNVAEAQPNVPLTGVSAGAETFRTGRLSERDTKRRQERDEIMKYLQQYAGA